MKRFLLAMAVVALAGCSKGEQTPPATQSATTPADTSKMPMSDTSKHMMAPDTSKKQ